MNTLEFARWYGFEEIARRSAPEGTVVSGDLLEATLDGSDRSSWTADEQAAADQAANRIEVALVDAQATVANAVPVSTPAEAREAEKWVRLLARYALYDDARPDHIKEDMQRYERWVKSKGGTGTGSGVTTVWLERV